MCTVAGFVAAFAGVTNAGLGGRGAGGRVEAACGDCGGCAAVGACTAEPDCIRLCSRSLLIGGTTGISAANPCFQERLIVNESRTSRQISEGEWAARLQSRIGRQGASRDSEGLQGIRRAALHLWKHALHGCNAFM